MTLADPNGETTCPDSPFPFLGDDCGEGINLNGASFAVLYGNVMQGNQGGILMSNELGATHDNVILRNQVLNNVSDCGITMASNPEGCDESGAPRGGIEISSDASAGAAPITDTLVYGNMITNQEVGVWVGSTAISPTIHVNRNWLGAATVGVQNAGTGTLNATQNH